MEKCHSCPEQPFPVIAKDIFCAPEVLLECEKILELKLKIYNLECELIKQREITETTLKNKKVVSFDKFENESLF